MLLDLREIEDQQQQQKKKHFIGDKRSIMCFVGCTSRYKQLHFHCISLTAETANTHKNML